jgi:hypothetical protein
MRWALGGASTHYPEWAMALDMAHGDPLRAKEIYESLNEEWTRRWLIWRKETHDAKIPDYMVGFYREK